MKIAITGGTGLVGRFFVQEALAMGAQVCLLGRYPAPDRFFCGPVRHCPYALGDRPDLSGYDAVVHCAFSHVPGRYRGGEGDDPEGFERLNLLGSIALFEAAKASGVPRLFFLSSRAVYGAYPEGTILTEALEPLPTTLYGEVKYQAERALSDLSDTRFRGFALRATGVYGPAGPNQRHKWADLFADFTQGRAIPPRIGTEVHGADVARVLGVLWDAEPGAYNVSDIILDRHDLLARVAARTGCPHPVPPRAATVVSAMSTDKLAALGWSGGGLARLEAALDEMLGAPPNPGMDNR